MSPPVVTLSDAQLEALAALIAKNLAVNEQDLGDNRLAEPQSGQLVDAARLAGLLGVSRQFVYQHAAELGAVRLGGGSKPRLRFDLETARAGMADVVDVRSEPMQPVRRRRKRGDLPQAGSVLTVGGRP